MKWRPAVVVDVLQRIQRPLKKNWSRETRGKGSAFTGGKDEEKKIRWQKNGRRGQNVLMFEDQNQEIPEKKGKK